jgi:hypothetical protein
MKKVLLLIFIISIISCTASCSNSNENDGSDTPRINTVSVDKNWFENRSSTSLNFPAGMIENKTYVTYTARFTVNTSGYNVSHNSTTNITLTGYTKCTYWGDFGTGYTKNIPFTITLYKSNDFSNNNTIYLYRSDFPTRTIAISRVEIFINSASGTIVKN